MAALLIIFIIGFVAGMAFGIDMTIRKVVSIIPLFANITIDYNTIDDALFRYHNNLGATAKCISISPQKA